MPSAEALRNRRARLTPFENEAKELFREAGHLENELAKLAESARELDDERERRQNEITLLKLRQADLQNKIERCREETARINSELEYVGEYSENVRTQIKEAKRNVSELTSENEALRAQADAVKSNKEASAERCRELFEKKREVDEELKGMLERISEITTAVGFLREEAGRLDVRRMRSEHEYDYNKTRLWEEYELTYTKAVELTGGAAPENLEDCRRRISELRGGIKRLGNVNVDSIEELERTQERFAFLTKQRKDVEETRTKLNKIISELTQVMQKQFREQFAVIRENFKIVFSELFGGGKADIILSDESDVLESGIEIHAQPPGKKLQNMMQLSRW